MGQQGILIRPCGERDRINSVPRAEDAERAYAHQRAVCLAFRIQAAVPERFGNGFAATKGIGRKPEAIGRFYRIPVICPALVQ